MVIGSWHPSVALTYAGAAVSALGMTLAVSGNTRGALACLVLAGLADLFDGPVARSMRRDETQRAFGVQLDSLVDVLSFVAFPVVLLHALTGGVWWGVPVLLAYAVAGLARLTFFTLGAAADDTPLRHYRGLPVTYAALIFPLAALTGRWLGAAFAPLLVALTAVVAVLFVLDVPVPKPRGLAYAGFGALAVGVLAALALVGG